MPHQCTGCGHTFEDGSKEMLSGCPDCGGNKFQFRPAGSLDDPDSRSDPAAASSPPDSPDSTPPEPDRPDPGSSSVAETVGRATTQLRDFVSSGPEPSAAEGTTASGSDGNIADPDPDAEWPDDWDGKATGNSGPESSQSPDEDGELTNTGEDGEIIDADANRQAASADDRGEDFAQASARSDVISPEELDGQTRKTHDSTSDRSPGEPSDRSPGEPSDRSPGSRSDQSPGSRSDQSPGSRSDQSPETTGTAETPATPSDGEIVSEPTGDEPDLAELREQLNDQFESIKILEPGQYELNLMELYDREEYIIALQENGRYVIQVPEQWIGEDIDDR